MKFNQYKKEGYTDFVALGHNNNAWNVVRSEFDALLLDHASSCGAQVFHSTKVVSLDFPEPPSLGRPTSATWIHTPSSLNPCAASPTCTGTITYDYVIDASGRAGVLSTKYLKNRRFNSNLKNIAIWGYWTGAGVYGRSTPAEGAPYFEALTDESGWAWFIPLHNGTTSVGVVMDQKQFSKRSSLSRITSPSVSTFTTPSSPYPFLSLFGGESAPSSATDLSSPLLPPTPSYTVTTPPSSPMSPTFSSTISPGMLSHSSGNLIARYISALELAPGLKELIGTGTLVQGKKSAETLGSGSESLTPSAGSLHGQSTVVSADPRAPATPRIRRDKESARPFSPGAEGQMQTMDDNVSSDETVRTASDYSYSANTYAGEGWRIVGDAGAFIDPFFSSGVHLAMTSGLSAAASVAASIRGDCEEKEAGDWHSQRVSVSYTRFLVVVLSAYKQMRSQSADVLSDIGEDNFDKAFAFLRPVIQGNADMGPRLSESEVQRALDFCTDLFSPTTPEEHDAVRKRMEELNLTAGSPAYSRPDRAEMNTTVTPPRKGNRGGVTIEELEDEEAGGTRRSNLRAGEGVAIGAFPTLDTDTEVKGVNGGSHRGGRKRSGTIDAVWRWLGKVSGVQGPGEANPEGVQELQQAISPLPRRAEISREPRMRRNTVSVRPFSDNKEFDVGDMKDALFDVTAPVLSPSALQDIVERVHPPSLATRRRPSLTINTSAPSDAEPPNLLPAHDIPTARSRGGGQSGTAFSRRQEDEEAETKRVLAKINARRVIHRDHSGLHSLEEEAFGEGGFTVRLEKGKLGLVRVDGEKGVRRESVDGYDGT
ncbi:hypothetical protein EW146_g6960 [Bondarzewia mesenterica]|uniref:FAD-binding domain-containing protein n=1 Tax=Bondarzewia mesenterica TaxID=1095465 RepID=A0A4S4LM50_9AGAM|nr:hypothetical protein EW146_g6960 [Bondarzewia mesenterica]